MYQNYSDEDLIEAYSAMIEYSGKPSNEMLSVIEKRGGIESFKKQIELKKNKFFEIKRITKEVYSLSSNETNVEFIKKLIGSDILSKEELDDLIKVKFTEYQTTLQNNAINSKTIIVSVASAILSCIVGAVIWSLLILFLTPVFYFFIVVIYIINYLIIKSITKKSRNNLTIFIVTLLATIGSIILGFYFASLLLPVG